MRCKLIIKREGGDITGGRKGEVFLLALMKYRAGVQEKGLLNYVFTYYGTRPVLSGYSYSLRVCVYRSYPHSLQQKP